MTGILELIAQFREWSLQLFNKFPLGDRIQDLSEAFVNWFYLNATEFFDAFLVMPIRFLLSNFEAVLLWFPWPILVLIVFYIGWRNGGWKIGLLGGLGLLLNGLLGYWELTMETIAMILTALFFCITIGIPVGVWASRNERVNNLSRLMMDGMQTVHPFVYLVPVVMLLGVGSVPGTIATTVFAIPPIVRLTNLGIRQVPKEVVEAGRAFGSSDRQLLLEVQIPLAMRTIMAGLNQSTMLALSMVVIVSLIAGGGLGEEVYRAVGRTDVGRSATSGLAVLVLAIVLDRISQASGERRTRESKQV